jgi:hypothetical protein
MQVVWHGSQQESFDLVNAIARNCTCEFGLMGVRLATCAPHRMLTEDQRALNGLLFARRMAERLRREEFTRIKSTPSNSRARSLSPVASDWPMRLGRLPGCRLCAASMRVEPVESVHAH